MVATEASDFLVLGGGTAGCVLADRLSEEGASVTLVEAGPDYGRYGDGQWPSELLDARAVPETHDWGLEGAPSLLRAKVIGGCSAHNACLVVWGSRQDYDEWAELGCEGWSFAEVEPYLQRAEVELETRVPDRDELPGWHRCVMAAAEAHGLPRLEHINDMSAPAGVGPSPLNVRDQTRWNTAFAYLERARGRPNLTIRADTLVDRVKIAGGRATGAVLRSGGEEIDAEAGTVLLAAGAYESPAILMRSGIGPSAELGRHGIEVVAELDGVGTNLVDHPGVSVFYQPSKEQERETASCEDEGMLFQGHNGIRARSELCEEGTWDLHLLTWISPDKEGLVKGRFEAHISVFAMKPASRGSIRLASADPEERTVVEQGFISDSDGRDLETLVDGVRLVRELAGTDPMRKAVSEELIPGEATEGEEELRNFVQERIRGSSTRSAPAGWAHPTMPPRSSIRGEP